MAFVVGSNGKAPLFALTQSFSPQGRADAMRVLSVGFDGWSNPVREAITDRRRTEQIVERACAAQAVLPEWKSPSLVELLHKLVRERSLHANWRYHGLDGAAAVRALVRLGDKGSVPLFLDMFRRVDPELTKIGDPADYPLSWRDFVFKMHLLPALGELPCAESKRFLLDYLEMDEARARELAPPQFEEATKAFLKQELTSDALLWLLRERYQAVRGTAVLEMLDHPTGARKKALKTAAPWALDLPRAR